MTMRLGVESFIQLAASMARARRQLEGEATRDGVIGEEHFARRRGSA
jgi:hypothetical protein